MSFELPRQGVPAARVAAWGGRAVGLALLLVFWLLAATVAADEIASLDEWWSAYNGYAERGEWKKTEQLVAEYKVFACRAFNEGLMSYREYRERKDIRSMRQFYAFLDLLSRQIAEKHGIDSYVRDLAAETVNDDELLGPAKQRKDAEVVVEQRELFDRFGERLRAGEMEGARQLIHDNVALGARLYEDVLNEFGRARNADDRSRMFNIHHYLTPLQELMIEAFPGDRRFTRYEPPTWLEIAADRAAVQQEEAREEAARPSPSEAARRQIERGIDLRERGFWKESIEVLTEAQKALEFLGVSPGELIVVHQELARSYLDFHDFSAAARAYRSMARSAAWIGDDERLASARDVLERMPPDGRPEWDAEESWTRWKTVKLKFVDDTGDGEQTYGPLREADPRVELWRNLDVTTVETAPLGPPGLTLMRKGEALGLDTDGDGEIDREPDFRKGITLQLDLSYPDGKKRPYAMDLRSFKVFEYMGFVFDHSQKSIVFCRRRGAREGRMGGTRIRITDDDGDGRYDGYARDGMALGRDMPATRLSRVVLAGSDILEIDVAPGGESLRFREYRGPKQKVMASTAFGFARNFLVAAADDPDVVLELAPAGRPVEIPVGRWRFAEALLLDETGSERVWVDGARCPVEELKEKGEPILFTIGRALDYSVRLSAEEKVVRVHGLDFEIHGDHGEAYRGFYPTPPLPLFHIRMHIPGTSREINQSAQMLQRDSQSPGHRDVEYPKDMVFEFEAKDTVYTKIFLEHAILGELVTDWRQEDVEFPAPPGEEPPPGEQPGEQPGGGQ